MPQESRPPMTFRAKPVVKRSRNPWETRDRRNFLINLGFGLIVVAALLILVDRGRLDLLQRHLASVGSVDGQSITKDELHDRSDRDLAARRGRAPDREPAWPPAS